MRLLMINPNTTVAMTDRVVAVARAIAAPGTEIIGVTGRFGARYVATRAAYAIAGHAALDAYAEHGADADVIVLACFGDPGLDALKEIAHQPVVGMAEAACVLAARGNGRFSIVTGGHRWRPMLEEFVASLGLRERLASVHTVAPTGGDIARDPEGSLAMLARACQETVDQFGVQSVILGGAGLAGLAIRIADRVSVPVIDGVEAVVRHAEALVTGGRIKPAGVGLSPAPVDSIGLGSALAVRLARG